MTAPSNGGGASLSPELWRRFEPLSTKPSTSPQHIASSGHTGHGALERLSGRERQVFDLLVRGLRYREIAESLFISFDTVRSHIRRIYRKLDVCSPGRARGAVGSHLSGAGLTGRNQYVTLWSH